MTVAAVIVAGGTGERFASPDGKQLTPAAGRPVLAWSIDAFETSEDVDAIVVVTHPERMSEYERAVRSSKVVAFVPGGETRQRSVAAGLGALPSDTAIVAVHDGARPLVTPETVARALEALSADPGLAGVVVGHPQFDTVKRVGERERVVETVDRRALWVAQTPQVFRADVLRDAYAQADAAGFEGTDDAMLVERIGGRVMMVRGPRENIKVTVPEDIVVVEAVLEARRRGMLG